MQLVGQTYLGFYFYIPGELKLAEASVLYSLKLGECCLNKKSVLCLHLISRSDHRGNFYYSYSARAPTPFGYYESETHLILNTDFHHESILPL